MTDNKRRPLGIWDCPNCGETFYSIDKVKVEGKRKRDFPIEGDKR
jgi:ribosomal protein L37AE/L43A